MKYHIRFTVEIHDTFKMKRWFFLSVCFLTDSAIILSINLRKLHCLLKCFHDLVSIGWNKTGEWTNEPRQRREFLIRQSFRQITDYLNPGYMLLSGDLIYCIRNWDAHILKTDFFFKIKGKISSSIKTWAKVFKTFFYLISFYAFTIPFFLGSS